MLVNQRISYDNIQNPCTGMVVREENNSNVPYLNICTNSYLYRSDYVYNTNYNFIVRKFDVMKSKRIMWFHMKNN